MQLAKDHPPPEPVARLFRDWAPTEWDGMSHENIQSKKHAVFKSPLGVLAVSEEEQFAIAKMFNIQDQCEVLMYGRAICHGNELIHSARYRHSNQLNSDSTRICFEMDEQLLFGTVRWFSEIQSDQHKRKPYAMVETFMPDMDEMEHNPPPHLGITFVQRNPILSIILAVPLEQIVTKVVFISSPTLRYDYVSQIHL
eukprot:TRINITY_DN3954_c0_g2_i1.p1 TRINITY_DN3954_c0_g2~~TRINITY_DN3954_c0_g2_i1.p1  ORF type:complete len:197 (-),score=47.35 TRINITY_DN3954_c0_g2_i1:225-815(-)